VSGGSAARLHLIVRGRVQGVFYRSSVVEEARQLRLSGWVNNRIDGSVEIVAEGSRAHLEALKVWAGRGPRAARVERVEEEWSEATGEFSGFAIR
jgi:acylphosphatase